MNHNEDEALWPEINRLRCQLIDLYFTGKASQAHMEVLDALNAFADKHLAPFYEARITGLVEMERRLADAKKEGETNG